VMIAVQDDGRGFNVTDTARTGRGISNMRRRMGMISTGGELAIESVPGKGTIVRLKLRVPKNEAYATPARENAA